MSTETTEARALAEALEHRFGERVEVPAEVPCEALLRLATRASNRRYRPDPVDPRLVRTLAACALSAPTKSDLQQADIVIVQDRPSRQAIEALLPGNPWVAKAPVLLVFCGNNRRQRRIHDLRGHPFANDHFDPFFNASVDAAIVLSAFVLAAESVGLATCPISAIRDHAAEVSRLLALPDHVFPVAGLAIGWPDGAAPVSPRLPLAVTVHTDRYDETGLDAAIAAYDARREAIRPHSQREVERFGVAETYGWSEDKARQYATPQRPDFGAFVRSKGFKLD